MGKRRADQASLIDEPLESLGAELKLPEWLDSIACKLKAFF
ncbi:hypothetical protein [Bacillus haynesii]|nr:hypothetical protein [Bacillus haynesii]